MTEHGDGPVPPLVACHAAERQHATHHPIRRAQSAQLDIQRDGGERPGQRLGEVARAENREAGVDPVVEFALDALGCRAALHVGRVRSRGDLDRERQLAPVAGGARGGDPAADQAAGGVGDCLERLPAELERPILLCRCDIHVRDELGPAAHPIQPGPRVGGSQHSPCGDHVDGVRGGEVHHTGAVGVQRGNQEAHQVVDVQHPHRPRRNLGAQHRGHGTAHHPVELAADRRGDADDQAGPPTGVHQFLGRPVELWAPGGLGNEQQPGAGAGGHIGQMREALDIGAAGRGDVDRCQVDHRVGLFGELPQYGVAQRRANELDVAVQAGVRTLSNAADRMPGSDQLPCNQPPECAGGVGNQDLHLGSPPPTSN